MPRIGRSSVRQIVPLAKFPRFVSLQKTRCRFLWNSDNAYHEPLQNAEVTYEVKDENQQVLASGKLGKSSLPGNWLADNQNTLPVG